MVEGPPSGYCKERNASLRSSPHFKPINSQVDLIWGPAIELGMKSLMIIVIDPDAELLFGIRYAFKRVQINASCLWIQGHERVLVANTNECG